VSVVHSSGTTWHDGGATRGVYGCPVQAGRPEQAPRGSGRMREAAQVQPKQARTFQTARTQSGEAATRQRLTRRRKADNAPLCDFAPMREIQARACLTTEESTEAPPQTVWTEERKGREDNWMIKLFAYFPTICSKTTAQQTWLNCNVFWFGRSLTWSNPIRTQHHSLEAYVRVGASLTLRGCEFFDVTIVCRNCAALVPAYW